MRAWRSRLSLLFTMTFDEMHFDHSTVYYRLAKINTEFLIVRLTYSTITCDLFARSITQTQLTRLN